MLAGEQWLVQNGIVTETSIDTLVGYGYMQEGIDKVELELNTNEGSNTLIYRITLTKKAKRNYRWMNWAAKRGGILGKLVMFFLLTRGAPLPGFYETTLTQLAKGYLPNKYTVKVNMV